MSETFPNSIEFHLDRYERSGEPSGMVIMSISRDADNMVLDALACDINVDSITNILTDWAEEHGAFEVKKTLPIAETGAEYIATVLGREFEEYQAQHDAEQAAIQMERDLIQANRVYNMLMSSSFETWYPGEFMDHVEGEEDALDKDAILKKLVQML